MSQQHSVVFLDGKDKPFRVATVDTIQPAKNEVLIRNKALAINPVDWKVQDSGAFIREWPVVLGEDLAGVIEAVGDEVTRFKPGQRVLAHSQALATQRAQEGSFGELVLVAQTCVAEIPESVSFEDAAVLPLAISTAAAGLYQSDGCLELALPTASPKKSGKTLLVWGGSSSVGTAAIQLAVASGVTVATTCSSRNQQLVEKLGAKFFDYNSPSIVGDLVAELGKGEFAGAYDGKWIRTNNFIIANIYSNWYLREPNADWSSHRVLRWRYPYISSATRRSITCDSPR